MAHIHDIKIGNTNYLIEPTLYGAATTSDSGANYAITLSNFELTNATGVAVQIKFPSTNAASAKLNVNSTGAKNIYYNNATISASVLKANHTYTLVYDGTQWQLVGDIDTNTWNVLSTSQAGYVAKAPNDTTKFLRGDANWSALPTASTDAAGIIQIGTGATNAAAGNHNHNSTYLKLDGSNNMTADVNIIVGDTNKFINFWYNTDKAAGASWRTGMWGSGSSDTNYYVIESGTSSTTATTWNRVLQIGQNTYDAGFAGNIYPISTTSNKTLGTSSNKWATIYGTTFDGSVLKLHQGTAADPSLTGNARIEFDYTNGQPVVISYTPNDSYRNPAGLKVIGGTSATPAWFEVEGPIYSMGGSASEKGYRVPHTGNVDGSVGGTTTPVYVDSGQIKALSYTIAKSVPSDAVFTDTTYSAGTGLQLSSNTFSIKDNAVRRNKLMMTDTINYAELNDYSATDWGFTADTTADGHWYTMNTLARDKYVSDYYQCNGGETFNIQFEISTTVKGNSSNSGTDSIYRSTAVGIYTWNEANTSQGIVYSDRTTATSEGTATVVNSDVTISANARKFRVFIQTESWGNFSGTLKIRKLKVIRVSAPKWYGDLSGNAATASGIKDYNNNSTITFGYSTSGMVSTNWLGSWDGYKLRAISPANAIKSAVGTTQIGGTTTPIYWTGSAFSAGTSLKDLAYIAKPTANTTTTYLRGDGSWVSLSDMGLSNALHFIGITSTELSNGSTTATLTAKSTNSLSKTTGFVDGDVVMDGDQLREYVWVGTAWRLLGITTSTAYSQTTTGNSWITSITQGTDGKITATTGTLNTSGDWTGTAAKATSANLSTTTNTLAVYTNDTGAFGQTGYITYLNHAAANAGTNQVGYLDGLRISGTAYGEAENLKSGVAGKLSYGDSGPQIQFVASSQNGALIFNHYDATTPGSAFGASFNFVTDQGTGVAVKANAFVINGTGTYLKDNQLSFNGGGGWYMNDTLWIRTVGSKSVYMNAGTFRNDGTTQLRTLQHVNGSIVVDGDWVTGANGTAPTATTTDGTTTYSGATIGTSILTLGNNKVGANTSSGVKDNAKGYLRIYGALNGYGELTYNDTMFQSTKSIYFSNSANSGINNEIRGIMATNDYWRVAGGATASNSGYMEIATADDGSEPIYVRQYTGVFSTLKRTLILLDASGNTSIPGTLTVAGQITGNVTGTASNVTGTVAIANGGTGQTSAAEAWTALGGGASGKHDDSYFAKASHNHAASDINSGTFDTARIPNLSWNKITSDKPTTLSGYGITDAMASNTTVTNVSYTAASDNAEYPILMKNSTGNTTTASGVKFNSNITINPSTNTITATTFSGSGASLTSLNASNISSGTLSADRLATSGATAGSYGDSTAQTPGYGSTFKVPYITVDNKGRVTGISEHTVKIPISDNTNTTYTIATGDSNGQIKVTPSSGSAYNINIRGFESGYINTHPENSPVLIPFIHNDIAFLTKRGGSVSSTYDGNAMSYNFENCFDGSGSYFSVSSSTYSTLIITLTLHKTFTWTNTIYIDFGATAWRAKDIQIEVMNSNYANDTWVSKANVTNNGSGHYYITMNHTPSGASNAGGGFNKIRFTLSSWSSTDRRISQIGIYNYGSIGARETYMSRGIDDAVYRSITPAKNNTYDLGSSTAKWANAYATTFNGNLVGNVTGNVTGTASNVTGTVAIANGGTGATTAHDAKSNIGLSGIFYGTCSTAAATTAKEVTCPEFSSTDLVAGVTVFVTFTNTNSGAVGSLTLSVNGTTAKSIRYLYNGTSKNNLPAAGYLQANQTYQFTYDGTYWITRCQYNTDNTDALYSASGAGRIAETSANGGIGIHRYTLQMMTSNSTWSAIAADTSIISNANANTNDTSVAKSAATAEFLIESPIIWQDTNAGAAPGATAASVNGYTACALNFRYVSKNPSLTIQKPVFLIGVASNKNTFKLDSTTWWTQTLPTTNDGKFYMLLGIAYSATNIYLLPYHPVYYFNGIGLQIYTGTGGNLIHSAFTINNGKKGVKLSHAVFTETTYVTQIVVTNGEANLKAPITWTSNSGYIQLNTATAVTGNVTGYILTEQGQTITPTATDIT